MRELPPWASRAAAISLVVALVLAVYLLTIDPLVSAYRDLDDDIARTNENLRRYEQIARSYPALREQYESLAQRQSRSGVYLSGDTDALAAAELQSDVSATIQKHEGKLRSVQILPVTSDGEFKRVSVRVQLTATLSALTRILYTLESRRPFVFIDNLDIKNRRARRARRRNQEEQTPSEPELVIRFDLFGYLRPDVS